MDVRNQGDQMVYQTEKILADAGDKLDPADKSEIESCLSSLKSALSGTDTAAIKSATDNLTQVFYKASEKLYSQANPQGGPNPGQGYDPNQGGNNGGNGGQQYYDADYEVVDDDDKK